MNNGGRHPALATRACSLFGVRYPIVQTGMGFVSDARLTAATAEAGGLGLLSAAMLDDAAAAAAIADVRRRTSAPFGVNIRASQPGVERAVGRIIDAGVRVVSFAGAPSPALMKTLRDAGVVVVPTVGAVRHARKVAELGVDAVIVQGGEGGGHTGQVPTLMLLQQVREAVDVPVIAAGGFHSGRGLVAALALGADGVAMGTRFLLTQESPVTEAVKQVYLDTPVDGTVRTTQIDGVPQRVLRTALVERLTRASGPRRLTQAIRNALAFRRLSGTSVAAMVREGLAMRRGRDLTWSQVLMAANAPMLYRTGLLTGRPDAGVVAAGQVVGLIDDVPSVAELIERIMAEASAVLSELTGSAASAPGEESR